MSFFGLFREEEPYVSPNQPFYDEMNDTAESLGLGRPFSGLMSPNDYAKWCGRMIVAAIEEMRRAKPSTPS